MIIPFHVECDEALQAAERAHQKIILEKDDEAEYSIQDSEVNFTREIQISNSKFNETFLNILLNARIIRFIFCNSEASH